MNGLSVALRLGRVSNLPTVWTNVLAGVALSGATLGALDTGVLALAASLFYVGGMYLNDAFDREIDARERPERPIPSGQVSATTVFTAGFAMLGAGEALLAWLALGRAGGTGWAPLGWGAALAATIVFYDLHHKQNPLSPLVMGLCRVLVYLVAGATAAASLPPRLAAGAGILLCYLIGLTYAAKQENLRVITGVWPLAFLAAPFAYVPALSTPVGVLMYVALGLWVSLTLRLLLRREGRNIPGAVARFIAGISLVDGLLLAAHGTPVAVGLCLGAFATTRVFQRVIPGT